MAESSPIGWSTIKPGLIELFSRLAYDEAFEAQWLGRSRSQMSNTYRADLFLEVTTVRVLGVDELRYDKDDAGAVTEFVAGQRQFILRVEAHVIDDSDDVSAMHIATRLQTRLRRSRSLEALDLLGVAIAEIGPAQNTTYKHGGRVVPRATLDVWFNAAANEDDPVAIGVIKHVEWTSLVADVDGVALSPPNVTDEMTPPLEP